jgi:transposase
MPRPLSNDLRVRIVRSVEAGASRNATAKRFGVSISTVVKLMQVVRATGSHEPKRMGGYRKAILAGHKDRVVGLVAARSDATLDELVRQLRAARITVGRSTLARYLNRIGLRFKKNSARQRTGPA